MAKESSKSRFRDLGERADEGTWIDPRKIIIKSNVRDFTLPHNIQSVQDMADNIIAVGGVLTPVIVRFENGAAILKDGERRVRGAIRAMEMGADLKLIRAVKEIQAEKNEGDWIASQILYNSKQDLTHLELSAAFTRLLTFGWSVQDISVKTSLSLQHVNNILKLEEAPNQLRELVANEQMSSSNAEALVREYDNKEVVQVVKAAKKIAKAAGAKKITKKHIDEATGNTEAPTVRYMTPDARVIVRDAIDTFQKIAESDNIEKIHRWAKDALENMGVVESEVA
jgi:ParB-like chromosome segregation protein Spo0J